MGKKGSWFSAIKRLFTPRSKEKLANEAEKKSAKGKKSRGKLKHAETKSFIPLFREPSSIEKILGEADEQNLFSPRFNSSGVVSPRVSSQKVTSPGSRLASSPRAIPQRVSSPSVSLNHKEISKAYRPEPTLRTLNLSATKIQAAYRGYMARRSFGALWGLVRLQGVVRSSNVKKQTANAMKQMQLLARVQTQIQSRRIQTLENQALQRQACRNDKEIESTMSKWTQLREAGNQDNWDDSLLTKEEMEARLRKKVEAFIKRERAMAYAYSHQLRKNDPKSALGMGANGFPWWWNWLERQLPSKKSPSAIKLTPPRGTSEHHESSVTPMSTKSTSGKQMHTPSRTPPMNKYSSDRANYPFDLPLKDDDSLTSCPPFSVPSYMSQTASAKGKARANSNPKERKPEKRFYFPLTPNIWSSKGDSTSPRKVDKHESMADHISVDSTVSMPAVVGKRRPFNRFV